MPRAPPTAWWCGCSERQGRRSFPIGQKSLWSGQRLGGKGSMSVMIDEASKRLSGGAGLRAIADFAAASHGRAAAWLVALCLIAFLPGFFTIPPLDRDEARFAQATKQMLESGDYVDIRFQDESRYKKPVGIYWLQAGVVKLGEAAGVPRAHTRIWLYRLVSLAGARLRDAPRRPPGRHHDGELAAARRRGAPRQDRRHAAVHRRGRHGGTGARLSRGASRAGDGRS